MKAKQNWHRTRLGKIILFLGSIRFAIPILALTACAMIYGTWIESTISAARAGAVVYGSWWFITLMILVCQTLILAVVTRYPWRKKHTGFIIVHAALITIIVSGFVTFFTNVEGEMALKEGMHASSLRLGNNELQLLAHENGEFTTVGSTIVEMPGSLMINDIEFEIVELWENSKEELVVMNDGLNKLHAIELHLGHADEGHWVGQIRTGEQAPILHGVEVRVLPEGEQWARPTENESVKAVLRHSKSGDVIGLDLGGNPPGDGWAIESIERFDHAIVGEDGLAEGDASRDNPAVQVTLVHLDGSRERHAAFDHFRSSINKKQLAGETFSEFVLEYTGETIDHPMIIFTRDTHHSIARAIEPGSDDRVYPLTGEGPWSFSIAGEICEILQTFTNARGATELVEAPQGPENQPVARIRVLDEHADHEHDLMSLVWGQRSMIQIEDEVMGIAYTPSVAPVPFTIELIDFRKRDYPGSDNAMAYESDVLFTDADGNTHEQTIWMNNPLEYEGWKVYQAGFVGDDVSIFQVARDPGLIPTYIGCIALCTGILVMNYSRKFSHGHPGMPKVFENKNKRNTMRSPNHAIVEHDSDLSTDDRAVGAPCGCNGSGDAGLEIKVCADPGAGPRAHDANGHPRKTRRGRSHRANKVG